MLTRGLGGAGERILEVPLPSPKSRRMDRLLAPRPDPAVVFIPGRRGPSVFHREPGCAGTIASEDDVACGVAGARVGAARSFFTLNWQIADELDV